MTTPGARRGDPGTSSIVSLVAVFAVVAALIAIVALVLVSAVPADTDGIAALLAAPALWFDPIFYAYNVLLLLFAMAVVPFITYSYVRSMRHERLGRLRNELPPQDWDENEEAIRRSVRAQFTMGNYLGSLVCLVIVVAFGASIILVSKPVFDPAALAGTGGGPEPLWRLGIDYGKGANFLLMGPFIDLLETDPTAYRRHLVISLTAFQFGFLGAYVYFIGDLLRGYFTLDITPHTFVASSVRMISGSLLALVAAYAYAHVSDAAAVLGAVPVVSFVIGHFPERGLVYVTHQADRILGRTRGRFYATDLGRLGGMSYAHRMRLAREGYESVENLSHARPLDIALRTGFAYPQARDWIGQAWLIAHLGERHYIDFVAGTGITGADDLVAFLDEWSGEGGRSALAVLDAATGGAFPEKIEVLAVMVQRWRAHVRRPMEPWGPTNAAD